MEPLTDHYWILGVNSNATERDIKSSYRQLALVHHPDKNPEDASATLNFRMVQEAYEVLVDKKTREEYDAKCHLYGVKRTRFHAAQYTENPLKEAANRKEQDRLQNLAAERIKADREKLRKQESERKAAEYKERLQRLAEERRKEAEREERIEAEKKEAERKETERIEAEKKEAERKETERIEAEKKEAERIETERIESVRKGVESAKIILEMLEKLVAENNVSWKKSYEKLTGIKAKAKGTKLDMQQEKAQMISAKAIQEALQRAYNHIQKAVQNIVEANLRIDSVEFSTKQEQFGATDENNTAEGLYTQEQDLPSWLRGRYWERTPDSKAWRVPDRSTDGEAVGGMDDSEINEEQWETAGRKWGTGEEYGKKEDKQETKGNPSVWADIVNDEKGREWGEKEPDFFKPKGGEWSEKEEDFLMELKKKGMEWKIVAAKIKQKFGHSRSPQACSGKYRKLKDQRKANYTGW